MTNDKEGGATRLLKFMLTGMMADVAEFHDKVVNLPVTSTPQLLNADRHKWAVNFLREEIAEYIDARSMSNLEDAVDALVELVYVAIGRLLEMGINPQEAWDVVHRANMVKQRGRSPHRDSEHDAMKPDGWQPPDLEPLIANMTLRAAVQPALLEATAIYLKRGIEYNKGTVRRDDHFPLGMASIFSLMWVKMIRIRSDVEAGHAVDRDHLLDLINYASFGVNFLDGRTL